MARVCLPTPHAHRQRNLAWANSVCLLFLIIGLAGFRPKPPAPFVVKPLEVVAPVIVEVLPPPPTTTELTPQDEPKDNTSAETPQVVVVTPNTPSIVFSVPTVGNVIASSAMAVAPPASEVVPRAAVVQPPVAKQLRNTGEGGDRPVPGRDDYPRMAQQLRQQGSLVLLLTANEAGIITTATVQQSSGSSILDNFSVAWVKRHWSVSTGEAGRTFLAPFTYKLE
jgi:periplasmic protein TonB